VGHSFLTVLEAQPLVELADAESAQRETLVPRFERQLEALARTAASTLPIRIHGETGVGKERLARFVHERSGRTGAFVAVNCAALAEGLLESTLFGHVRGAFSGAVRDTPGLVVAADGGTLFLDELGDLPAAAQAALLRVLQESEVLPVGASAPRRVDLRLVCATHKDLEALTRAGEFRQDLLARVSGFTLNVPPLRERRADLGLLIAQLLAERSAQLSLEAARLLTRAQWPMNVRQLQRALQAALALAPEGVIKPEHLPKELTEPPAQEPSELAQASRDELIALLRKHRGNISAVARETGKARMQIQRWMKQLALDASRFR
jgi:sigma-54 dependent transcriptional regulator, acetoin dehydrogenase operon transcriptional activator AcoR